MKYYLWLSTRKGIKPTHIKLLFSVFNNAQEIYDSDISKITNLIGNYAKTTLQDKNLDSAEKILQDCISKNIDIITIQDDDYPQNLKSIINPPLLLYIKGKLPKTKLSVCIVGARRASPYGLHYAKKFSYNLALKSITIVSGIAPGIDIEVQKAAFKAGKASIAILPNGLDICYPKQHQNFLDDIISIGCAISEYPPSYGVLRGNFPMRNRLLSGISDGLLIPEAELNSGSLLTANSAKTQGKPIFALCGNINSPYSAGTNLLIKSGATLATCTNDIISKITEIQKNMSLLNPNTSNSLNTTNPPNKFQNLQNHTNHTNHTSNFSNNFSGNKNYNYPNNNNHKNNNYANTLTRINPNPKLSHFPESIRKAITTDVNNLTELEKTMIAAIDKCDGSSAQVAKYTKMNVADVASTLTMLELSGVIGYYDNKYTNEVS